LARRALEESLEALYSPNSEVAGVVEENDLVVPFPSFLSLSPFSHEASRSASPLTMSSYFQVDATSIVILVLLVIALAAHVYLRPSPPHLHPFLLGRQSTAAPTRFPGESPAYRGTGGAGFGSSYRPATTVRTLADVLGKSNTCLEGGERGTWVKGGEKLIGLVDALRAGLLSKFAGLEGKVLVAVSDPTGSSFLLRSLFLYTAHISIHRRPSRHPRSRHQSPQARRSRSWRSSSCQPRRRCRHSDRRCFSHHLGERAPLWGTRSSPRRGAQGGGVRDSRDRPLSGRRGERC
jgi:hypothetical protein